VGRPRHRCRPLIDRSLSESSETDAQKKTLHASEQKRPDVAEARTAWRERQAELNPRRLVFIDETWVTTNMTRRYGRARRGQRLVANVPHGRWKTSTFLAALRHDKITAPCIIDGAINGETFRAYIEQFLVPTLAPGDIVIMDNLSSHKVAGVGQAIRSHRRNTALPAALQPGSQPDRAVLRQAQGHTSQSRGQDNRHSLYRPRHSPYRMPRHRMRKLPRQRRIPATYSGYALAGLPNHSAAKK